MTIHSPARSFDADADASNRLRLGDTFVALGLISRGQLATALNEQRSNGGNPRLGRVLLELGMVSEADVSLALATAHRLPLIDLDDVALDPDVARLIPRSTAERAAVLAYGRKHDRLQVAVADPVDVVALDDIRAVTGMASLDIHLATETQIRAAVALAWANNDEVELVRDFIDEVTPPRRRHRRARPRAPRRRRSASSTGSSDRLPATAPATSTSSRSATPSASASASTACCARSCRCRAPATAP